MTNEGGQRQTKGGARHIAKKTMVIAISGKSGCGNSSISRGLAKRYGYTLINYTFREYAHQHGLRFEDIHRLARRDRKIDYYIDNKQVELARQGNCVVGSRLAIWKVEAPDLRIYLKGSGWVRARRIARRERKGNIKTFFTTLFRDTKDYLRYMRYYRININRFRFADMIIDTKRRTVGNIINLISKEIDKRRAMSDNITK